MGYKIIGDSCMDITKEMRKDPHFQIIPLTLQVDDVHVIDDETFDQQAFLKLVRESPNCPKTACPSPETFKQAYMCPEENVYVITLSSPLSGSYNSAVVGRKMYEEEFGPKNIAVIDSWSASPGEMRLAMMIQEYSEAGMEFGEIVEKIEAFKADKMRTYFVLESLDALKKNGRLTGLSAFFATALNIKPVMSAEKGVIIKLDQARGINKALVKMCAAAVSRAERPEERIPVIAHCNNRERAEFVKRELLKLVPFKDVLITETAGVATVYASDGGIILAI